MDQRRLSLNFDVYRASIPDIPPLPFDDINTAAVQGQPSWDYAGIVTLSCTSGLTFEPTATPGRNQLVVKPNAPVRVRFKGSAWRIQVLAEPADDGLEMAALVDGVETLREKLDRPSASVLWRTRDVSEIVLRGEGTVSFIGFHLLEDSRFWAHIAHRCLPVHDAALGLGATRWETIGKAVLPYCRSGLVGAVILGLGRAMGETMAVTMVIGNGYALTASLFVPGATIASKIASEFSEATTGVFIGSLVELALILFAITLAVNVAARVLVWRLAAVKRGRE